MTGFALNNGIDTTYSNMNEMSQCIYWVLNIYKRESLCY